MVPVLPEPAHASGSTAQHAPSKSPDFQGSDFDRGLPVLIEAERAHILVRSRQSKTRSLWMKKPTAVIDSVTFIASKSSRTFSSSMIDPPPAATCGSSRNRFVEAAA